MLKHEPGFNFEFCVWGKQAVQDEERKAPDQSASPAIAGAPGRAPRTARGRKTQRTILDAAAAEFGEKGFHDSSIVSITARAGVALGSFYTYFESKDALFRALVRDMSGRVRDAVAPVLGEAEDAIAREGRAFAAFLQFARTHQEIYRIIDEAEFVAPEAWRTHYERTAQRIQERLADGADRGEVGASVDEVHAWAIMGMNVFLGLRFGVHQTDRPVEEVARIANALLRDGLSG